MTRDQYRVHAGELLHAGRNQGLRDHEICEILGTLLQEFENGTFDITQWIVDRSPALDDIDSERHRHGHKTLADGEIDNIDDDAEEGILVRAAVAYAQANDEMASGIKWPFSSGSWDPGTRRVNLVKAAALLVAEIDRIDRQERVERSKTE